KMLKPSPIGACYRGFVKMGVSVSYLAQMRKKSMRQPGRRKKKPCSTSTIMLPVMIPYLKLK
ncbi:MAG: hypothetical protein Q9214_008031, partial [Letrouitia sp. 1 TL-2023]